ncbi:MAG: fibronectin type III domain-containing protein, partial [Verrucomicrobiae bacterium]|nr:fibronectin type III domain-containing protein [Verrucomicrobiae bacterium]
EYYEIRFTTGDPGAPGTAWTLHSTSKKSVFELDGLPSGQMVWVQVRAINARGRSPWSDPACKRVP